MWLIELEVWAGSNVELHVTTGRSTPSKRVTVASRLSLPESLSILAAYSLAFKARYPTQGREIRLIAANELTVDLDDNVLQSLHVESLTPDFTSRLPI